MTAPLPADLHCPRITTREGGPELSRIVAGWTRILSSSLVNEFRISHIRADSEKTKVPFGQDPPAGAKVPGVPEDPLFSGGVTGMEIDGYFGWWARIGSPNF